MHLEDILAQCLSLPGVSLTHDDHHATLRLVTEGGHGTIDFHVLWPGFTLAFIRVAAPRWPAPKLPATNAGDRPLLVNLCLAGRCELCLDDGRYVYVSAGDCALSERYAAGAYVYPRKSYEGVEFFIEATQLERERPWLRADFGLDIPALVAHYGAAANTSICTMNADTAQALRALWQQQNAPDPAAQRRLSLSLFAALAAAQIQDSTPRTYYTASQVAIAKEACAIVTADLRQSHPAHTLAARFGISESSLKNYFRGVYGQSLAAFVRESRLTRAAELLQTTKAPVSAIAEAVGYLNQSKFTAVFKRRYGVTPLEFRRLAHLKQDQ